MQESNNIHLFFFVDLSIFLVPSFQLDEQENMIILAARKRQKDIYVSCELGSQDILTPEGADRRRLDTDTSLQ